MKDRMSPLLSAHALDVSISHIRICQALELAVAAGERWAILGRNGVGKSTLLATLAGLRAADAGELRIGTVSPTPSFPIPAMRQLARIRGVLTQHQSDPFPATVLETALVGRHPHLGRWGWEGAEDVAIARRALAEVGLADFEQRDVQTLSGGERQRVAIAALLTQAPRLFLLDEPLNHLDLHHQIAALDLFQRLVREDGAGRGSVLVLHDINLAARYADHIILLDGRGGVMAGDRDAVLRADLLSQAFGHPLRRIEHAGRVVFLPD